MKGCLSNIRWPSWRDASLMARPQPFQRGERGSRGEAVLSIQQALWVDKSL
jgi:hypothetical protein